MELVGHIGTFSAGPIDEVAHIGIHLQVDLRLGIEQRPLVREIAYKQGRGPRTPGRSEAQVDQPVRRQMHQKTVDVLERDGLAVRLMSSSDSIYMVTIPLALRRQSILQKTTVPFEACKTSCPSILSHRNKVFVIWERPYYPLDLRLLQAAVIHTPSIMATKTRRGA